MHKSMITLLVTFLALLVSTPASACGESLYRVGKGVAFRDYSAPLPGRILMLATTEGHLAMAEILEAAGHDVHVVAGADQIGAELTGAGHEFDLVMSMYDEHEAVQSETARVTSPVAYLPVAAGHDQLDAARAINRNAPSSDDRVNTILRAIHRTLLRQAQA